MNSAITILSGVLEGILNRVRGGWGDIGHVLARVLLGAGLALIAYSITNSVWSLVLIPGAFITALDGWHNSLGSGRIDGVWHWRQFLRDQFWLCVRGLEYVAIDTVFVLGFHGSISYALVGLTLGPLYELGYRLPIRIPHFTQGPEVGEALFGFVRGAAFAWALLG